MSENEVERALGRKVVVWTHILNNVEEFVDAVAQVQPNGVLLIVRWNQGAQVPLKGYAPGTWLTFEHQGDYTTPALRLDQTPTPDDPPTKAYVDSAHAPNPVDDPPVRRRQPQSDRSYERPKAEVGPGFSPAVDDEQVTPLRIRSWSRRGARL